MSTTVSLEYLVPAMSCGHCVNAITAAVSSVPGVSTVAIDLDTKAVVVTGIDLNDKAIRLAIAEAGFEVAS